MLKNRKIRYGIVGCNMGHAHMQGITICNNSEIKAICDIDEKKLQTVASEFGISSSDCYTNYTEMITDDNIDAIVVATPDHLHVEQTIAAMEAGKHVLCEKPMAPTVEECASMIKASESTNKKLMIGQICRYAPGFVRAKRLIDDGQIGELFFVESEYAHDYANAKGVGNWRSDANRLRQPVIGGGCHAVDLLRWIAGDPYEVFAYANKKVLKEWPVDDCTIAVMKFPNEVLGKVMVSIGCKRKATMRSVFYGDKGTIIADNSSPDIILYKDVIGDDKKVFEEKYEDIIDQRVGINIPVKIASHNVSAEINEFSNAILNNSPVITDGKQGAYTVAVCNAIVESVEKKEQIRINYNFI